MDFLFYTLAVVSRSFNTVLITLVSYGGSSSESSSKRLINNLAASSPISIPC